MYIDSTPIPFGRYKFTRLDRLPPDYLLNFRNDKTNKELQEYVVNNLEKIMLRKQGLIETKKEVYFPCNKIPYIDEKSAKAVIKVAREKEQKNKKPVRAYECKKCGGWHLTSIPLEEYEQSKI